MERIITVTGQGNVSVAPDQIAITFNLETNERGYEQTMDTSAHLLDALGTAVHKAGLARDALKTTNFSIDTKYERCKDKNDNYLSRFAGYVCTHNLRLEFALDMKQAGCSFIGGRCVRSQAQIQHQIHG